MTRTVLVTGATGYIARHVIAVLLDQGDRVVGSVRTPDRDAEVRAAIGPHLRARRNLDRYRSVALDLMSDEGWDQAMQGVDAVLHIASPFPLTQPKNAEEVIRPAVDGTLRALGAAHRAGVRRVVVTSSSEAVRRPEPTPANRRLDESDWTDPTLEVISPYTASKVLAERAAWDFVRDTAPDIALTALNPSFVQGPPLGDSNATSFKVLKRLVRGRDPMVPHIGFACVDVRDVAEAHARALDTPASEGLRILLSDRFFWMSEIGRILKARLPGRRIPTREAPDWMIRALGLVDPQVRLAVRQLGEELDLDNTRMRRVLGIAPRDAAKAIAEAGAYVAGQRV